MTLKNYVYGVRDTDHHPLTFAVSGQNTTAKIKRSFSTNEVRRISLLTKQGTPVPMLRLLERGFLYLHHWDNGQTSGLLQKSNSRRRNTICRKKNFFLFFENKTSHVIEFSGKNALNEDVKLAVNPNVVNAIHCDLPTLAIVQHELVRYFQQPNSGNAENGFGHFRQKRPSGNSGYGTQSQSQSYGSTLIPILLATVQYIRTIHKVTKERPILDRK